MSRFFLWGLILFGMTHIARAQDTVNVAECIKFYDYGARVINHISPDEAGISGYYHIDIPKTPDDKLKTIEIFLHKCAVEFNKTPYVLYSGVTTYKVLWLWLENSSTILENIIIGREERRALVLRELSEKLRLTETLSTIPACDNNTVLQMLKQAVSNSPFGRTQGLQLLDVDDIKDASSIRRTDARKCNADGLFNGGEVRFDYYVKWFGASQQNLIVTVDLR